MKRIGYLFDKVISIDNLYLASKKAQRGKASNREVIKWNRDLDVNISALHESLKEKTYKVSEYKVFTIYESKERVISKLPFVDRVVHHALINHLESIFVNSFISQTYSCIKGRGIHRCLNDLRTALKDKVNTVYCLKLDLRKFYPSISNDILKEKLRTKFKDKDLLWLLDSIINSHKGQPLGNMTSQ